MTVVFTPCGLRGRFPRHTTVLDAARSLGVDLDSVCGGRGICGRCQVLAAAADFAAGAIRSDATRLSPPDEPEMRYAAARGLDEGRRLGCHARLLGDVAIEVPTESRVHAPVFRKSPEVRSTQLDPVTRLHLVELTAPCGAEPAGATIRAAMRREWDLDITRVTEAAAREIESARTSGNGRVTAAVRHGCEVVAVWPGLRRRVLGLSFDIGSTTIAGHLCELGSGTALADAGCANPQSRFGEDVMSRVSYAMRHDDGAERMTEEVRGAVDELAGQLVETAGAGRQEVLEIVIVGNPVMQHLYLGADPTSMGTAPFSLAIEGAFEAPAAEMGLAVHGAARVYAVPCISGHVGADTAAVLLAEAPEHRDEISLIVDVGTNAEVVLGNKQRLLACSSPTGPAFEGGQVSCGQRAVAGAIERVRIDRQTLEPRIKVIGCDLWSDDPGFDHCATRVTGICGSGIIEAVAEMFLAGIVTASGNIRGALTERSARVQPHGRTFCYRLWDSDHPVSLIQEDIRAIQLAKAALHAGARLLMRELGVERVDRIRLAGAFGSQIDPLHAMVLGMIPDCCLARVSAAGNAAGTGARLALLSGRARGEVEELVTHIERVEIATAVRFQQEFVDAMAIPHAREPFTSLRQAVLLPAPAASQPDQPSRRRRRPRRRR